MRPGHAFIHPVISALQDKLEYARAATVANGMEAFEAANTDSERRAFEKTVSATFLRGACADIAFLVVLRAHPTSGTRFWDHSNGGYRAFGRRTFESRVAMRDALSAASG